MTFVQLAVRLMAREIGIRALQTQMPFDEVLLALIFVFIVFNLMLFLLGATV